MKRQLIIAVAAVYALLAAFAGSQAVGLGTQKPIEMALELGTKSGEPVITPSELKLQTGKLYKLIVNNPSDATHYLSVPEFGTVVHRPAYAGSNNRADKDGKRHAEKGIKVTITIM